MAKDSTVVSIRGGPIYQEGSPNPYVIEMLETMLERARAGKMIGCVAASLDENGHAVWERAGQTGGFGLIGAVAALKAYLSDRINEEAE